MQLMPSFGHLQTNLVFCFSPQFCLDGFIESMMDDSAPRLCEIILDLGTGLACLRRATTSVVAAAAATRLMPRNLD